MMMMMMMTATFRSTETAEQICNAAALWHCGGNVGAGLLALALTMMTLT